MISPVKLLLSVVAVLLLPAAILYSGSFVISYMEPRFTYSEMDLNKNGLISFGEADYVISSGEREILVNGKKCVELYALKDGLQLKIMCHEKVL